MLTYPGITGKVLLVADKRNANETFSQISLSEIS